MLPGISIYVRVERIGPIVWHKLDQTSVRHLGLLEVWEAVGGYCNGRAADTMGELGLRGSTQCQHHCNQPELIYSSYVQTPNDWIKPISTVRNIYIVIWGGGSRIGAGRLRSNFDPPGAVGAWYGSGCFHFSSKSSASWNKALCCLGSLTFLFASNNDLMYSACPRHKYRWTDQSRANFKERR